MTRQIGRLTAKDICLIAKRIDGSVRKILDIPYLTCRLGEKIGIMGKNGSGKSSLARILAGLNRPSSGSVRKEPAKARILLILQRPEDLFIRATVGEQIASYSRRPATSDWIYSLLENVGLPTQFAQVSPLKISTGQQRLAAIACALAAEPEMIIMDEPMAGLDYPARENVRRSLSHIKKATSSGWIIISHHPDDLLGVVDRIWLMEEGQVIYDGDFNSTPAELLGLSIDKRETSWYWILRQMGLTNELYYATADVSEIVSLLQQEARP